MIDRRHIGKVLPHAVLGIEKGRLVTGRAPQAALRSLEVRFSGITRVGDVITCTGKVVAKDKTEGQRLVRIDVQAVDQHGERKTAGVALVALA